ncbi:DNA-binding domain-containing protein [Vibrio ziniensis]|uniref:DUF2063 domain-containing protein n=1 Tax=Vibrio ziniensis TaxID=2711221 RepID=A0A6G7CEL8_9VIBR|nr:DNA-binding domain-containing protein [Vibrio ziniensis]QIH40532.1 DUF2063 domain-containing protein [Vibrio ziniensis]
MNVGLAQLQATFAQALRYQAQGSACDIKSGRLSADDRLQIYRNNFVMSLTEVLQATYPMLLAVLGEECFGAIARHHILSYPLKQGNVSGYGEHFNRTIEKCPNVTRAAPYALELAIFEWQLDRGQQIFAETERTNVRPLSDLERLTDDQQNRVVLHLYPWVSLFKSHFALFDLQQAIRQQNFDELELMKPQSGMMSCDVENGIPWVITLSEHQFEFMQSMLKQTTLEDLNQQQLAEIPKLAALQVIAGFTLKNV